MEKISRWCLLLFSIGLASSNNNNINNNINNNYYVVDDTKDDSVFEPTWTYRCISDEGCQRADSPLPTDARPVDSSLFESVDVCRTVCGRFGGLWPRPVTAALSMQTVKIHPNFLRYDLVDVPAETRPLLAEMTHVVGANLLAECGGNVTDVVTTPVVVYVTVQSADTALDWSTDEHYMLDVQSKAKDIAVHIIAETIYGVRHALETFTQLISSSSPEFSTQKQCALHLVAGAKIRDRPVYKYRGFLLDSSRNFIPLEDIKRTLDGMAATKLNVFHWHVTDTQSFPLESPRIPQFTRYGAYTPSEIYTTENVKDLIKYAQIRGIRVVIEVDSPAHAGNGWQWGPAYGLGDLAVCVNSKKWREFCIEPPCGQLNPANPAMYRVLRDLYRDIAELVPHPTLLHMGGDEVFFPCWNSSEEIRSYMSSQNLPLTQDGFIKLWAEFHQKALQAWDEEYEAAGGKEAQSVMLWSSLLTSASNISSYLDRNRYIIEVWEPVDHPLLNQLIRLGFRTVSVPKDVWYLDHGFWGQTRYGNWRRMYAHTLPREDKMLGGEAAMWSEYVDAQGLDTRVWPRLAAVAERLWADPISQANAAEPRLQRLRSRLVARGLRPDVMSPGWCAQHDGKCL